MKTISIVILFLFGVISYAQNQNYSIKNIDVNTKYSDFGVSYCGNNEAIFASSKKVKGGSTKKWHQNNQPFLDLYKAKITDSGELIHSEGFSKTINTIMHESNVCFTKDGKTVYFSRDNYTNNKYQKDTKGWVLIQLYKAEIDSVGNWNNIIKLPFNSDQFDSGHPALDTNGTTLYFTSNRPGSYGLTDIWAVDLLGKEAYGEPYNLGPNVNTPGKEMFPFMDQSNVLYYSSNGIKDSNGELDIYAIKIENKHGIDKPLNLGFPINSVKDDFSLVFQANKRTGHFASNREGGKGDDDIYYFEEFINPFAKPCNQFLSGVVREKETNKLLPNATVTLFDDRGNIIGKTVADQFAVFNFDIACSTSYKITAEKENYAIDQKTFATSNNTGGTLSMNLDLNPSDFVSMRGKLMIKINPIYFDLDKYFIRNEAKIELEKVVKIMQKYPLIIVDLGSHTDSRGSDFYNWTLSYRRAKASKDWIVAQGIDSNRIKAQGYGEIQLVNKCANGVNCSVEEHQLNRRTEFVITNPEVIK